jgi:hypothetical protein
VPSADTMRPSVRSCFTKRTRLAPIARRTLISCRRTNDRTSSRLPTLAQAMSRTNATTATMTSRVGSSSPAWLNGVCQRAHRPMLRPRFVAG